MRCDERSQRLRDRPLTSDLLVERSASALWFIIAEGSPVPVLSGVGRGGTGGGMRASRLRMAIAAAAAQPAASSAAPARIFGMRRERGLGGSRRRAVASSMAASLGATDFCTETLPRAALIAIHVLIVTTFGPAHSAADPAWRFADIAAFIVIGRA